MNRVAPASSSGGPTSRRVALGRADRQLDLGRVAADVGAVPVQDLRSCARASARSLNECQMSACRATRRSVFFSPPPPIRTGILRVGGGLSLAQPLSRCAAGPRRARRAGRRPCRSRSRTRRSPLEPARPDAEDQPAVAHVVDGAGHVGEQFGVAVAVAGDQRADLDAAGLLGPGAEHRPALEVLAVGVAVERIEVVPVEDHVDADVLGPATVSRIVA